MDMYEIGISDGRRQVPRKDVQRQEGLLDPRKKAQGEAVFQRLLTSRFCVGNNLHPQGAVRTSHHAASQVQHDCSIAIWGRRLLAGEWRQKYDLLVHDLVA